MPNLISDAAAFGPAVTGGVSAAPTGTALPTTATATPNAAFKKLGRVDDQGLQPAHDAASTTDLRDWEGEVVASVQEFKGIRRFTFGLIGVYDEEAAKFVFGSSNVTVTNATTSSGKILAITDKGDEPGSKALIFDMLFEGKVARYVIPNGKCIVTGEKAYTKTGLSGFDVQVTCSPDSSGVRVYRYLVDDVLAPA